MTQDAYPPLPPPAYLDLTVQGSQVWTSFVAPQVHVNGWPLEKVFGRRTIPVPPGPVRVDVVAQWWKPYGQASLAFIAAPGQVVPVFYASPYHVFADGSIGHVKQRRRGLWVQILVAGIVVVPLVVIVATIVLASS